MSVNAMSTDTENRIVEKLDELNDKVDRVEGHLSGGDDPGRGIIVRLDRLEQSRQTTAKVLGVLWVAVATALAGGLWATLSRLLKP